MGASFVGALWLLLRVLVLVIVLVVVVCFKNNRYRSPVAVVSLLLLLCNVLVIHRTVQQSITSTSVCDVAGAKRAEEARIVAGGAGIGTQWTVLLEPE